MAIRRTETLGTSGSLALDYIFHPRSVAVVGRPGFGGSPTGFVTSLKKMGFPSIYPVNPKHQEIDGLRCYSSLFEVEGPVDHVICSVPADEVARVLEDCVAKKVKCIAFFTAGFSETGKLELAQLESRLVARAREAGIRVLGPNCMGLYAPRSRLSFRPDLPEEGGPIALIAQSGGNAGDIVISSACRGIRYSKVVSYGNASDINESELLEYLTEDPETEIVAIYIEGTQNARHLLKAMRRAAAAKPVVVLKGGRGEAGTRASYSHTASLAGSFRVFEALCRQTGAVLVRSMHEAVDVVVAFHFVDLPLGPRVAVVGGGGGLSVLAADQIEEAGLYCPVLPERIQGMLGEFISGAGASVCNPVDTFFVWRPAGLEATLASVGQAENIDVTIFHLGFNLPAWPSSTADSSAYLGSVVAAMARAREATAKPIVVVVQEPLNLAATELTMAFQENSWRAGFPVYSTVPRAANAIAKVLSWQESRVG